MIEDKELENDYIISFENYGFKYDAQSNPTLFDINLKIKKGEKVLICGPSGCGKSTLVHCINGLIPISYKGKSSGSLLIGGKESNELSLFEHSKIVGTVLQDSDGQFIGLTVAEDIAFALENDCIENKEMKERVKKVAEIVDVVKVLKHAPHELSGGQKQRVGLGGVMVEDVDVLLFDEPLANLDPATGKQAIDLINEIHKKTGCAVIIIEHRVEDVLYRNVDRIVVMDKGHIIKDSDADDVISSDIFKNIGIREPLYVTALKYSQVDITKDKKPAYIDTLTLNDADKTKNRNFFDSVEEIENKKYSKPLLEVKNVSFTYDNGHNALKDINVTVHEGEMISVVGTNGAGKSTFSKVICGFEKNTEGTILFDGIDLSDKSIKERASLIGYVMQNPNQMISKAIIYDEVALGLRNRGVDEDIVKTKVEEVLKVCDLYSMRNWPISALSYGQKKRVTIASILVLEPKLIILDEPTAGQDLYHYTEIMDFLSELNKKGITIVLITHDMHIMIEYTERAVVFNGGTIIADTHSADVLNDKEIVEKAHLKETSLYYLCEICNIATPKTYTRKFISKDREERKIDKSI